MQTLTALVLCETYVVIRTHITTMADHYALVYYSYVHMRTGRSGTDLSASYISLIMTSRVRVPRRLLCHYTDHRAHRCPHRLLEDLRQYVEIHFYVHRLICPLQDALLRSIADLPPADREELTADVLPDIPTIDSVSILWCRVLTYAMAQDWVPELHTGR